MNIISSHTFKHALRDIHKNTENRKFCFVIGAGASVSSGIPTGGKLAKDWFDEIKERYSKKEINDWITEQGIDHNDLAAHYGSIYRKRFETDKTSGYEFLVQAMRTAKPSVGHIILGQILSRVPGHCVLTTNFDSLVETSIYQFTDKTPLVCGHESLSGYARPSHIHPLIIKIHRDLLLDPKSDPDEINKLDSGWNEPLDNIFSTHIPIVIGYGGNDGSLMSYFEQMKKPSNFFWCGIDEQNLPNRVKQLISNLEGQYVQTDGFDRLMHELLWVFDEIKPIKEELGEITKSRIETATEQLNALTNKKIETAKTHSGKTQQSKHQAIVNNKDIGSELSALEYASLAEKEADFEKRAEIYLEGLKHYPKTAWLWHEFIYFLHFEKKDYSNLNQFYLQAISIDPNHSGNIGNYAVFLDEIKGDYENAEKYYLIGLSLDDRQATNLGNYALFLKEIKKDYVNAEKYYLKALSTNPENINVLINYASFLTEIKRDYISSEKHLLKALLIDPDSANALGNYANFLFYFKNDFKNAETAYQKALSIDHNHFTTLGGYAVFLKDIKRDYENAEKHYLKALSINDKDATILGNYAQFLLIRNESKKANEYIKTAISINSGEKNDTLIELWFYRYAHYKEFLEEAEKKLEQLLAENIKSIGWNLDDNVKIAIENGHPYPEKLRDFVKRITTE
jgi:protein O-mannosyl-transferase